ncbi:hypothetical protein HPC49_44945 [Pyxidicoccus fallax]|uniref:Uncharacterized protein n=1 Tax=Pyxidicoccus fallax TaxID=394095 RepID=A0A848LWT8_9BACT|nr:hypothetical protein [Pyxidicoccus fallax]NMO21873.1 hypothetical protein [Pyxidicoccus fallax]NPC85331.1 hypothetical protein [Pyxidicoccus fallax]
MAHDGLYWNINLLPAVVIAGNILVPVLLTTWLATSKERALRRWGIRGFVLSFLLVCCPGTNWMLVEPLHTGELVRLGDKAREAKLEGRSRDEVRALLGDPTWVSNRGADSELWEYSPVPLYVMGSTLLVRFNPRGTVESWVNFDD